MQTGWATKLTDDHWQTIAAGRWSQWISLNEWARRFCASQAVPVSGMLWVEAVCESWIHLSSWNPETNFWWTLGMSGEWYMRSQILYVKNQMAQTCALKHMAVCLLLTDRICLMHRESTFNPNDGDIPAPGLDTEKTWREARSEVAPIWPSRHRNHPENNTGILSDEATEHRWGRCGYSVWAPHPESVHLEWYRSSSVGCCF